MLGRVDTGPYPIIPCIPIWRTCKVMFILRMFILRVQLFLVTIWILAVPITKKSRSRNRNIYSGSGLVIARLRSPNHDHLVRPERAACIILWFDFYLYKIEFRSTQLIFFDLTAYAWVYIYIYMHARMHACTHADYICLYIYNSICGDNLSVYIYIYIYILRQTRGDNLSIYMYIYIYIYI